MRHPVLPQPNGGGAPAGHGTQPVVGVGHLQARGETREQRRGAQQRPAQRRNGRRLTEKPAAQRKVGTLLKECLGEVRNVGKAVLAVGIERDDYLGRLRQRVIDAGL